MTGEHPFDVDAVRRAIETHHPASIAETAEVAVTALSDRLATLNRYREALEHIEQHGFNVDAQIAREALDGADLPEAGT